MLPGAEAKKPGSHATHSEPSAEAEPGEHGTQLLESVLNSSPGAQLWAWPATGEQATAPGPLDSNPAEQVAHACMPVRLA